MQVRPLAVVVVGLGALGSWLLWPVAGVAPTRPEPEPGVGGLVPRSEPEARAGPLAASGESDMRRSSASLAEVAQEPREGSGAVRLRRQLTPAQKVVAIENARDLLAHSEDAYRRAPTGTDEEMMASLQCALDVLMSEAAVYAIQDDEAWVFVHGEDDEAFHLALRNVPGGWRKQTYFNVATTEGGIEADLVKKKSSDDVYGGAQRQQEGRPLVGRSARQALHPSHLLSSPSSSS